MSSELATAPVTPGFHKATTQLSAYLGIEPKMMIESLKKQCFPSMRSEDISDAQLAAFISVANTMGLNPLIPGHLYAYPSKNGGIVPVCGPDGVLKKLDEFITGGKLDGYECTVFPEDIALPPTHAVAKIFRAGKDHPSTFTAIFKEWSISANLNWASRPRHMLWLRAIKQCARQVIHGVPFDEDDVKIGDMVNVTPTPEAPERPAPPARAKKGAAAVQENATKPEVKQPPVTVDAEIVPENPVSPTPEAPKGEKVVTPEPKKVAAGPRDSLNDKEELVAVCKIDQVFSLIVNIAGVATPSVQAVVSGGFIGTVFHFGGASKQGDELVANPGWKVGSTASLSLLGRFNNKTSKIMVVVNKITAAEATPESPAMSVE